MTVQRDPDAILAAWLEEGPDRLPDATRRAIAVTTRTTHQSRRPRWVPWRFPTYEWSVSTRPRRRWPSWPSPSVGCTCSTDRRKAASAGRHRSRPRRRVRRRISFDSHGLGALEPGTYVFEHLDSDGTPSDHVHDAGRLGEAHGPGHRLVRRVRRHPGLRHPRQPVRRPVRRPGRPSTTHRSARLSTTSWQPSMQPRTSMPERPT